MIMLNHRKYLLIVYYSTAIRQYLLSKLSTPLLSWHTVTYLYKDLQYVVIIKVRVLYWLCWGNRAVLIRMMFLNSYTSNFYVNGMKVVCTMQTCPLRYVHHRMTFWLNIYLFIIICGVLLVVCLLAWHLSYFRLWIVITIFLS